MRFHFATIPIFDPAPAEAELNRFLATHRVVGIDRQLVANGDRTAWVVCVSYSEGPSSEVAPSASKRERIDYKEVLSEPQFRVFAKLRELRKQLAERDGVPPYALFNNEQLAAMVTRGVRSKAQLGAINGVGPARVEKYGTEFLARMAELTPDAEGA